MIITLHNSNLLMQHLSIWYFQTLCLPVIFILASWHSWSVSPLRGVWGHVDTFVTVIELAIVKRHCLYGCLVPCVHGFNNSTSITPGHRGFSHWQIT